MVALYPLVIMSELITRLMARRSSTGTATVSREEIAAMAHLGREEGIFGESESRILRNLFRIGSLRARDIMTPRPVMFSLPSSTTVRQVLDRKGAKQFSRIPIWQENEDDVVGYVLTDEVLLYGARDELDRSLEDFKRDMLVVPDSLPVATFFEQLLDRREHIALIVDEWGGVAGIATMEDVVETLLGLEIVDEADTVQDMREMARKRWTRRAKRLGVVPSDYPEPAAGAKPSRGRE
jgi:CBS domain containing-hemolysin-like protein